jgi:creatinine amidohydrolase
VADGPARLLGEIDSRSFERELARRPLVIVPVGALEAHGPHLPLAADQIQAEATARALAPRLGALVAPTLPYGVCAGARAFPGTISLSPEALSRLVAELLGELGRHGARRVLVLSGHAEGRHMAALREGADRARRTLPDLAVVVLSDYEFVYELRGVDAPNDDGHAGRLETSRMLALAPASVGPERPVGVDRRHPQLVRDPSFEEWPESVVGDTRGATGELGERVQAHVLRRLEATVRELLPP